MATTSANLTAEVTKLPGEEMDKFITVGPAAGKINGINHMMLVCKDFEASLRFYRDLLGFQLVTHTPGRAFDPNERRVKFAYDSISFFRVADNICFGLYEIKHAALQAHASTTIDIWPELEEHYYPTNPYGLDHISFEVPTWKELLWFKEHLEANDVAVSQVFDREDGSAFEIFDIHWPAFPGDPGEHPYFRDWREPVLAGSIYFYDPDGNALEISSRDTTRD